MSVTFDYAGKAVIVTGASGALGRGLCVAFAERGARLAICGRSEERLARVRGELEALGRPCVCEVVDVAVPAGVQEFVERAARELDGIDVLVNNAAIAHSCAWDAMSPDMIEREVRVNYLAPAQFIKEVLPLLRARGCGQIINISSVAALVPYPYLASYSASKAALAALTQALQVELRGTGIDVINVYQNKLSAGMRSPPVPGSLHYLVQERLGRGRGGAILGGADPRLAAERIVRACSRRKYTVDTWPVGGRALRYLGGVMGPILRRGLYYAKVKSFV